METGQGQDRALPGAGPLAELEGSDENAPLLMCVLDGQRRVISANDALARYMGVAGPELLQGRACGVFGCINALGDARGCGFGPNCANCQLRLCLVDTYQTGTRHANIDYRATLERNGVRREVYLIGSTALIQAGGEAAVLLSLKDATGRGPVEQPSPGASALGSKEAALLSSILESPAGIIVFALDLEYRYAEFTRSHQEVMRQIWGKEIARGMNMLGVIGNAEDRARAKSNFDRALRGEHLCVEEEYGDVALQRAFYENRYSPLRDQTGEVAGVTVFVLDVTERKRAELALREREAVLASTQKMAQVGSWKWNLHTNQVEWSDEVFRIFGVSRKSFRGDLSEVLAQSIHPADRAKVEESNRSVREQSNPIPVEYRIIQPGGAERVVWAEAGEIMLGPDGRPAQLCGFLQDITERKQAERKLRKSEERFRLLYESMAQGIVFYDRQGNMILANPAAERILGLPATQLLGRRPCDPIWQATLEGRSRLTEQGHPAMLALRTGRPVRNVVLRMFRPDTGVFVWVNWNAEPQHWEDDSTPDQVFATLEDITERKEAERAMRQSQEQLRALSLSLESAREEEQIRISRQIHDELGQMLTGLKFDLHSVESSLETEAGGRLNPVLDKVVSASELVETAIVAVQRIASELRPGVLERLGLIEALRSEVVRMNERSGILYALDLPSTEPLIPAGARVAIFRIFREIVTNVLRHANASFLKTTLVLSSESCTLEVEDNGRGASDAELNDARALGVLSMREQAREQRGTVTFARRVEGGLRVTLRIPTEAAAP